MLIKKWSFYVRNIIACTQNLGLSNAPKDRSFQDEHFHTTYMGYILLLRGDTLTPSQGATEYGKNAGRFVETNQFSFRTNVICKTLFAWSKINRRLQYNISKFKKFNNVHVNEEWIDYNCRTQEIFDKN